MATALIVVGSVGGMGRPFWMAGTALLVAVFLASACLALWPGRRPLGPIVLKAFGVLAAFYLALAGAAALADPAYSLGMLIAGLVPITVACVGIAVARRSVPAPTAPEIDREVGGAAPRSGDAAPAGSR